MTEPEPKRKTLAEAAGQYNHKSVAPTQTRPPVRGTSLVTASVSHIDHQLQDPQLPNSCRGQHANHSPYRNQPVERTLSRPQSLRAHLLHHHERHQTAASPAALVMAEHSPSTVVEHINRILVIQTKLVQPRDFQEHDQQPLADIVHHETMPNTPQIKSVCSHKFLCHKAHQEDCVILDCVRLDPCSACRQGRLLASGTRLSV